MKSPTVAKTPRKPLRRERPADRRTAGSGARRAGTGPISPYAPVCACGGGCPACRNANAAPLPHGAERMVLREPDKNEQTAQAKQTDGARGVASEAAAAIGRLRGGGRPLDRSARAFFEPRIGTELSQVRLHDNADADAAARAVGARAFTLGQDIAFADGQLRMDTTDGRRLMAHELAHVVQNRRIGSGASVLVQRDIDDAYYPTEEGQEAINQLLNPRTSAGPVDPVDDPVAFREDMLGRFDRHLQQVMPAAREREGSGIRVPREGMQEVADIAEQAVLDEYGDYVNAVPTPTSRERLRETFQEVPTTATSATEDAIRDYVESRMLVGTTVADDHNVVSGTHATCGETAPAAGWSSECRDRRLFIDTRDAVIAAHHADLQLLILNFPGFEIDQVSYVQARVREREGIGNDISVAYARWRMLHTFMHEMLHTVTHPDFVQAIEGVEENRPAVEGFTEYFASNVYMQVRERATNPADILDSPRMDIEGALVPEFDIPTYDGTTGTYADAVRLVRDIRRHTNEDGLRAAYFLGRVEYIGLGSWSSGEARRQHPANQIGLGVLIHVMGGGEVQPYIQADYVRVLAGTGGRHQLQLQGDVAVATSGDRIAAGLGLFYDLHTDHFYFRPGVRMVGSGAADLSADTGRLDFAPAIGIGARFYNFRVGADAQLLVPIAQSGPSPALGGRAAPQGLGGVFSAGVSYEF